MLRLTGGVLTLAILFSASCTNKDAQSDAATVRTPTPEAAAAKKCDLDALREMKTNSAFISYTYCALLGRAPDDDGRDYWTKSLASHNDRLAILLAFVASSEFDSGLYKGKPARLLNDEDFVTYAFKRILIREPTATEKSDWKAKLAKRPMTHVAIAEEIVRTRESRELHRI